MCLYTLFAYSINLILLIKAHCEENISLMLINFIFLAHRDLKPENILLDDRGMFQFYSLTLLLVNSRVARVGFYVGTLHGCADICSSRFFGCKPFFLSCTTILQFALFVKVSLFTGRGCKHFALFLPSSVHCNK